MSSDAHGSTNWIEQIVATSESEPPEETVIDLFGPDAGLDELTTAFLEQGVTIEASDYFLDEETRHAVHFDDRVEHVPCVADALQVAVMVEADPVIVHSIDPVSETTVTFEVGRDSLDVRPETHVVSIGFARELVEALPESESVVGFTATVLGEGRFGSVREDADSSCGSSARIDDADFRSLGCAYINAFESPKTYSEWADGVDAVSVALPAEAIMPGTRAFVASEVFD